MARRFSGKKFRSELFHVDGLRVNVEVRIDDHGVFYAYPDGTDMNVCFQAPTLKELRDKLRPHLEKVHRLEFDPYIDVEYNEAEETSRFDNKRDLENRQEVVLEFKAGWLSRGKVEERRRWIEADVDPDTCVISPLTAGDRQEGYGDRSSKELIPFTGDRWRRLIAIAEALADVRRKIASVLTDATGAKLEAMALPRLLEAVPAPAAEKKSRKA